VRSKRAGPASALLPSAAAGTRSGPVPPPAAPAPAHQIQGPGLRRVRQQRVEAPELQAGAVKAVHEQDGRRARRRGRRLALRRRPHKRGAHRLVVGAHLQQRAARACGCMWSCCWRSRPASHESFPPRLVAAARGLTCTSVRAYRAAMSTRAGSAPGAAAVSASCVAGMKGAAAAAAAACGDRSSRSRRWEACPHHCTTHAPRGATQHDPYLALHVKARADPPGAVAWRARSAPGPAGGSFPHRGHVDGSGMMQCDNDAGQQGVPASPRSTPSSIIASVTSNAVSRFTTYI